MQRESGLIRWAPAWLMMMCVLAGCRPDTSVHTSETTSQDTGGPIQASEDLPWKRSVKLEGFVRTRSGFFDVAENISEVGPVRHDLTDRMLVTEQGVYSFLETPANAALLDDVQPGKAVRVTATEYPRGRVLWLETLDPMETQNIDEKQFSSAKGKPVRLSGKNRCQCHLFLAREKGTCELGHLHHFQDEDFIMYHYLPTPEARQLIRGWGEEGPRTHNKTVTVDALLLPGHHLLVKSFEIAAE